MYTVKVKVMLDKFGRHKVNSTVGFFLKSKRMMILDLGQQTMRYLTLYPIT